MGYGMGGHLRISAQQSFGTAMTTSFDSIAIVSESVSTNIQALTEEGMNGRYDEGNSHEGLLTVEGDIVVEAHPVMLGHFLRGVMGQSSGTLANSAYTHEYIPTQADFTKGLCAVPPYTAEIYRDVGSAYQLTDMVMKSVQIDIAGNAFARATVSVMAKVSSLQDPSTPVYEAGDPWTWDATSLSLGGVANADMENLTVTIDNVLEGVVTLNGTKQYSRFIRSGRRTVRYSGTLDFISQAEYNVFRGFTKQRLLATLTGATVADSYTNELTMDLPQALYTSFPQGMSGAGRVTVGFEGKADYDTTSSYTARMTLTNTREGYAN